MKKRSIGFIIGLMGFALLGVVAMQYYFLRQSYQLQTKLFDRSVSEALSTVVSKLARQDANRYLNDRANSFNLPGQTINFKRVERKIFLPPNKPAIITSGKSKHQKKIAKLRDSLQRLLSRSTAEDFYGLSAEDLVNVRIHVEQYTDEYGVVHQRMTQPEIKPVPNLSAKQRSKLQKYDTIYYDYSDPQLGRQVLSVTKINPLWQREHDRQEKV